MCDRGIYPKDQEPRRRSWPVWTGPIPGARTWPGWRRPPSGWLGFRRLSIMGLDERGMQPFALGRDRVVCNGELYGWREQRAELEQRGYTFRSGSDCEILLPMYREYGLEMFSRLDAEFALILYDAREVDEYHRRPGPHRHPAPVLRLPIPRRRHRLCQRGQTAWWACAGRGALPFPPGHYYYRGEVRPLRRPRPRCRALLPADDVETVCRKIHDKLIAARGKAAGRRRRPWAFSSPAGWTPAWCAPSPPGCWESPSAPLPSAWTPTPST